MIGQFGPSSATGGVALPVFDSALTKVVFPAGNGLSVWNPNGTVVGAWIVTEPKGGTFAPGVSVLVSVEPGGTTPISCQWFRDGQPLVNGGHISGAQSPQLVLNPFSTADIGTYRATVSNACSTATSTAVLLGITSPCSAICYANCDQSTACPTLTANDFMCYLQRSVMGHSYADCDGVGGLTAGDFICFLSRYNNGCT